MDLGLNGKTALVTAASKGLGRAIATGLAAEGCRVAICARNAQGLREAAKEMKNETGVDVLGIKADVTSKKQIESLVQTLQKEFGRIDVLVCNAGGPPMGTFDRLNEADFRWAIELNLMSTINLCRLVLPDMRKNKWGRIINLTSISAKQPLDDLMLSNTARAGVLGFSKTLANEVAATGITVNCICPGYTLTNRLKDFARDLSKRSKVSMGQLYNSWQRAIPAKRLAEPHEIANVAVFLASERAAYVTGIAVQIDGGFIKSLF
jgi:3-oxoacyl-[acyl-carrier protein] reductase